MGFFLFVAAGAVFADMDPQLFYNTLNIRLGIANYAAIQTEEASTAGITQEDLQKELRGLDENRDGYFYAIQSISFATDCYVITSVNHQKTIYLFLSNDTNFTAMAKNYGWKDYGNIYSYANLKAQLIKDFDAERAKIGIKSRSTTSTIN
jgi:hypothetical protein